MRDSINGAELREMLLCAFEALEDRQREINELNVFPVPDGDTGTNMTLTVSTAAEELLKRSDEHVGDTANRIASAMLRGARGNSGVILSLLFRGIAKGLKDRDSAGSFEFAAAMCEGVDGAYKAVMKPAEGTILTVSRVATKAAYKVAEKEDDFEKMLAAAVKAGREALKHTTEQNPVLKRAGVVDAGGMGYVVILEAFLASLQGKVHSGEHLPGDGDVHGADFSAFDTAEITFAYDTVYIMRKEEDKPLDLLRAYLDSIGDSLVISEDDEMFKVHVHTNEPWDALNESAKYGVLETAKIENMRTQHDELAAAPAEKAEPEIAPAEKPFGFVAVCAGEGLAQLFRDLGCDRIVTGGQTMNPCTEDILREVNKTPAETVFVLPNNKNIIMAAEQCIPLTEKKLVVIPTKTVPQGVTAMISFDPDETDGEAAAAVMTEAIGGVHTAMITYAARDSEFDGYSIRAGEYLGLMDGALLGSETALQDLTELIIESVKELDPEFVTVYYGEDVSEADAAQLECAIAAALPNAEMNLVNGGQPVYYYMISAE